MGNDINSVIQTISILKKQGRNPNAIKQIIMQKNPQYQQLATQMQNMAQGRSPKEFIMQLAKQNGADEVSLQAIAQMFDNN